MIYSFSMNVGSNAVLVSVIMPLYNMEKYLRDAINSILSQTLNNFELIIVDDGSVDESASIVRSYSDTRIRFFVQQNSGVCAARNFGLSHARGKYVAFVDPDDYCLPTKFSVQASFMESSGIQCTGTLMYYMSRNGFFFGTSGEQAESRRSEIASGSLMPFALSSIMINRSLLSAVGLFDERFKSAEDHELLSRVAKRAEISTIMERLGAYRIHNDSVSNRGFIMQGILSKYVEELRKAENFSVLPIPLPKFVSMKLSDKSFIKLLRAKHYFRQAGIFFISRRYLLALLYITCSFFLRPKYAITRLYFRVYSIVLTKKSEL